MTHSVAPAPAVAEPLPDVRLALAWRGWGQGFAEARERGVNVLVLAEHAWSTGAQRLALVLGREDHTRDIVERDFVPVLVDPLERPDVAARLRWAATVLTGSAGPPLLALATPTGRPFLAYCSLWPEGRDPYPSLGSLLRAVAESADDAVEQAADDLEARARAHAGDGDGDEVGDGGAAALLRAAGDDRFGGLREIPKHPRPGLLWRALDDADDPQVREHVIRTLDGMQRGGILDQLAGGFHRCSRDERWVVPHFEKVVPLNAGLAAVYARAANAFARSDYMHTAAGAATFAATGLERGALAIGADADHYTWVPSSVNELLEPSLIQVAGLHFNITRDASPHVLFRALDVDEMGDTVDDAPSVLAERLGRAKSALLLARATRRAPESVDVVAPAWRAETIRWLFEAAPHGIDVGRSVLERHLGALLDGPRDPERGFARDGRYWLEDQAAILGACLAAERRSDLLERAASALAVVLDAYVDPTSGALYDAPRGDAAHDAIALSPSVDVVDHVLAAAVPTIAAAARRLAAAGDAAVSATERERFAAAAARIEGAHRGAALAASLADHGGST